MKKAQWFIAGGWYTRSEVTAAGKICGWRISGNQVLNAEGHVIGSRYR